MPPDPHRQNSTRGLGFLSLPNDDPRKIVAVALTLCLVCSILVASAAVLLRPFQERNQARAIKQQIVSVAGLQADAEQVEQLFAAHIESRIVALDTGNFDDTIDPDSFDQRAAARSPATSTALAAAVDIAKIRRRANHAPVYLVRKDGHIKTVILPVRGAGLWSTLYGFLALAGDGRTITGLTFYEHAETPGLGDAIEQPAWQARFHGKSAFDDQGKVRITVTKGALDAASPEARFQVDGIAGATLTSDGVNNLLRFWLGDQGYGPFLAKLQTMGDST